MSTLLGPVGYGSGRAIARVEKMNYFHDIWTKVDELKASTLQQEKINNIKQCLVTEAPVNRTITDTITVNTRGNEYVLIISSIIDCPIIDIIV